MKLNKTKLGFTLIELLVVITIIGILATWAVSVYTSQIQKARDSNRLTDVGAIKSWVEQFYQDNSEYPHSSNNAGDILAFSWVTQYTPKLPQDPKYSQARVGSAFDYIYTVNKDTNGVIWQIYEVSTTFESNWNITSKAKWDGWNDDNRLELWINLNWNDTNVSDAIDKSFNSMTCVDDAGDSITCVDETTRLLIRKQ